MACESCNSEPVTLLVLPSETEGDSTLKLTPPSVAGPLGLYFMAMGIQPEKSLFSEAKPKTARAITYIVNR